MSRRAADFFSQWVSRNLASIDGAKAAHHVSDLLIDAAAAGIPSSEFDEEYPVLDNHLRMIAENRAHGNPIRVE